MKQNILKFLVITFLFQSVQIFPAPFLKDGARLSIENGYSWEFFVAKYKRFLQGCLELSSDKNILQNSNKYAHLDE